MSSNYCRISNLLENWCMHSNQCLIIISINSSQWVRELITMSIIISSTFASFLYSLKNYMRRKMRMLCHSLVKDFSYIGLGFLMNGSYIISYSSNHSFKKQYKVSSLYSFQSQLVKMENLLTFQLFWMKIVNLVNKLRSLLLA